MSNKEQLLVEKIRTQYTEKERTELDELRELDERVRRPVNVFSYVAGSISAVIMGAGMSLVMTEIGQTLGVANPLVVGIIIGVAGLAAAIANYPLHKAILKSRKEKYSAQIIALSEKIINK